MVEKIFCECCNKNISKCNISAHKKTPKHIKLEEQLRLNNIKINHIKKLEDQSKNLLKIYEEYQTYIDQMKQLTYL